MKARFKAIGMFVAGILILHNPFVEAQFTRNVSKVGTTAATFLEVGVGARALAMGEAFVALADDQSAAYWNPAGLAGQLNPGAQFFHLPWLADITFDHASAVIPLGSWGVAGLSITGVTMNDMPVRTIENPDGTGEKFGANNVSLGISYARRLTDRFSFGVNAKHIQEQIWHMTATTTAFDIGTLYRTGKQGFRIGMSVSNFGQKLKLEGRDTDITVDIDEEKAGNNDRINASLDTWQWSLPLLFRVGISMDLIHNQRHRLVAAVDAIHPNNNVEYMNTGLEYTLNNTVALRMGYSNLFMDGAEQGLTLGAGLQYKIGSRMKIVLDYFSRSFGVFNTVSGYAISLSF